MNTSLIKPEILKGTRDFGPETMAKRRYVMDQIEQSFIRFGYDTIETPVIEYAKTLLGKYGDEGSKLTYSFEDNGGRQIALRYDQTVPLARFVAMYYAELPMPFKRYQISRVWRADKPAKGRYREFYQCDVDVIGTNSLLSEVEMAMIIKTVFERLGFERFVIAFSSRRLINSVFSSLEIPQSRTAEVLRELDKLSKTGEQEVRGNLGKFLKKNAIEALMEIVLLAGTNEEKIANLNKYDTSEVQTFLSLCKQAGLNDKYLQLDLGLARGLDYYTGIVYEVFLTDFSVGAVCAGGRYDDLCSLFSEKKISGVGVAFGFDRIMTVMEESENLKDLNLNSQVLISNFDSRTLEENFKIAEELRAEGIITELYFEEAKLAKQLKYADKKRIPFVILYGADEAEKNCIAIKMMRSGKQQVIPRNQITNYLKGFIY